jgi:uncharacterized protein (TIGR03083 family)
MAKDEQAQFVELAASLTAQEWSAPSLCTGLSVRDVVVHIAAHIHGEPSTAEIVRAAISSGFSPARTGKMLDRNQRPRHAWRSPTNLVAWLASPIAVPGSLTQLSELMIHQQDIRRALDRPRAIPADRLGEVLDFSTSRAGHKSVNFARWRMRGLRLVATDMTWTRGVGSEVAGPGEALLMAINGRDDALTGLTGPGTDTLARRTQFPEWATLVTPATPEVFRRLRTRRADGS